MAWGIILKKLIEAVASNWKAIAVAAVVGASLWIFLDWRGQAAEISALEYELSTERQLTRQWRDIARTQSDRAKAAAALREQFERDLAAALARPPEVITIIRDAAGSVPTIQPDTSCEEAIAEMAAWLRGIEP